MVDPDRLFNPHGRRHFRKRYSLTEVKVGAAILVGLGLIGAWVAYRGARPDPELFGNDPRLIPTGGDKIVVSVARSAPREGAAASPTEKGYTGTAPVGGRFAELGATALFPNGWSRTSAAATFGPENLYEKINGREGFYKGYGFKRLDVVSAALTGDESTTIDIEWFELGSPQQALSAFGAERPYEAEATPLSGGLRYLFRNMLALQRGANYVRLVASAESEPAQSALRSVAERFEAALAGSDGPWSFALFEKLGLSAGQVTVEETYAFSFEFTKDVHIAQVDEDMELFVTQRSDADDAQAHAAQLMAGFASLGETEKDFVKDRYLDTYSAARSTGPTAYGVRGAPSVEAAQAELDRLRAALEDGGSEEETY